MLAATRLVVEQLFDGRQGLFVVRAVATVNDDHQIAVFRPGQLRRQQPEIFSTPLFISVAIATNACSTPSS